MTGELPGPVPKKRFPTPVQAVVLTLAGFAMTFFGCLGAITAYDTSDVFFGIALVISIAGALGLVAGLLMVGFLFVKGVVRAFQDNRKPSRDAGSPPADSGPPPAGNGGTDLQ